MHNFAMCTETQGFISFSFYFCYSVTLLRIGVKVADVNKHMTVLFSSYFSLTELPPDPTALAAPTGMF